MIAFALLLPTSFSAVMKITCHNMQPNYWPDLISTASKRHVFRRAVRVSMEFQAKYVVLENCTQAFLLSISFPTNLQEGGCMHFSSA